MTIIEQSTALSTMEQTELERCEQTIDYLRQAFTEAGAALATIREQRLYRAQYRTFEEYCQQRWGFSRVQAHRLIQAAEVQSHLLPIGNIVGLPENEAQARPLGKLDTPEEQQAAWQEAVERSGGKPPTAKIVEQVVQERAAQRIDSLPREERQRLFERLARRRLRETGGSMSEKGRTYILVRDVDVKGDMREKHEITYVHEADALLKLVVPPTPPSQWDRVPSEAELAPPPEKDAFGNIMRGAMVGAEFEDPEMFAEEEAESEQAEKPAIGLQPASFGLQPDYTYVMSPSEKRLCRNISDQYGCTVRQVTASQGRTQELWNATCEGVTIATTNTLKNMPTYIEQAIAWKSEHEQEMAARGYHVITHLNDGSIRFGAEYLPRTASGGFQTVDLPLTRIAAIRKRSLKYQGAINIYLSMLTKDGHLVGAVDTDNPTEIFAWLEGQGYWFQVTTSTWQAPPLQVIEHEELALPDDWVCSKVLHNEREWWRAYAMLPGLETNLHPTEEAAIVQALYIKHLDKRFHELGWKLQHLRTEGWQIQRTFKGDNAPGEIEEFLYGLENLL